MFLSSEFADEGETGIVLSEEEERKVPLSSSALRVSNKSIYTSWIRRFRGGEGRGKGVTLEAFLSYWLSRYILPSGPEDGINAYVFTLAIRKGEEVAARTSIPRVIIRLVGRVCLEHYPLGEAT